MTVPSGNAQEAIAAAYEQFISAVEAGDASGIAALYCKNGQVLPPGSEIAEGAESLETFWTGALGMGVKRVAFNTLELEQLGDTAIEIGRVSLYIADGTMVDQPKYLVVWKQEEGQWKMYRDIWNSDTAAEQN